LNRCKARRSSSMGVEAAHPDTHSQADEPLDTAVALGLGHEGGWALDAEEGEFALLVVGDRHSHWIMKA